MGTAVESSLEHLLDSGGVTEEAASHLEALGGDIAHGGLDVVGDPFDEVGRVLVLDVEHLLVDFLGGHAATEHDRGGEVAAVAGVGGAHHVLGIEGLLGELGHSECTVLLGATGSEGGEANHEEVKTGEGDEVHGELAEVGVKLTGEADAGGDAGHGSRHEVVEVTVGGGGELEGTEADVVKGFVVKAHALISVFYELVDGEGGVVGFDDGVRNLGGGADRVGGHDTIRVLLTDLGDEKGAHAGTSAAAEGVGDLEALEAIAGL